MTPLMILQTNMATNGRCIVVLGAVMNALFYTLVGASEAYLFGILFAALSLGAAYVSDGAAIYRRNGIAVFLAGVTVACAIGTWLCWATQAIGD